MQWDFPDGAALAPDDVIANWISKRGCKGLVDAIAHEIRDSAVVLTFNSRDGTSMHPDHRAVGFLVQAALAAMAESPTVYTIENRAEVTRGGSDIHFLPVIPPTRASPHDAQSELTSIEADWHFVQEVGRAHKSQFDQEALKILKGTPLTARIIIAERLNRPLDRWQCPQ